MNSEQFKQWIAIQERQTIALEKIANLLSQQLPRQPAPNYQAVLEKFQQFDWSSIGATVEIKDSYGVALVNWNGQLYQRRSPDNAYGAVIFFSRCIGKADNGTNQYERLITFKSTKEIIVNPISRKAEGLIVNENYNS